LEIISPGGFPPGITPENILDAQNPRNRRLAESLDRCGLIERSGQGMNLMVEQAIRQGKSLPSFTGTSEHEVRLTLEGAVENPEFVRFMERLGAARLQTFSTLDFLALDCIRRDRPMLDQVRGRLPGLIEAGAIESIGRGRRTRYILQAARGTFVTTGANATMIVDRHTRQLDHETNKALLEQHLQNRGYEGAPISELLQVLPSLSLRAIQRLLNEMREEGRVTLAGQRRWARWMLVAAKDQI
ncbi:MAG: transcriptional regulator, partial [Chloroflexi bacterium]|nr:transcriptional regulator [Chloroflexota bacterium]